MGEDKGARGDFPFAPRGEDDFTTNEDGTIDWTLYDVPEEVQKMAEAAAKEAGMTLAEFVAKVIYAYEPRTES
jgi:hypothetical protein